MVAVLRCVSPIVEGRVAGHVTFDYRSLAMYDLGGVHD